MQDWPFALFGNIIFMLCVACGLSSLTPHCMSPSPGVSWPG
uniref:Uncharacterized protein n=1 Tax=Arundo donax TaxID=35708 RepID=A0A0A9GIY4_ARUDO